jgi:hypothetical protein
MSPTNSEATARYPVLLDTEERSRRVAVIEAALQAHREHGYRIDARCWQLCLAYLDGTLDMEQLRAAIMRPHLN